VHDDSLRRLLPTRILGFTLVLCSLVTWGLVFSGAQASAAGEPEAPITESCSGPIKAGVQKLCGTLNPHTSAKVGSYFAYNSGASCTGGSETPAGGEVEGQNIEVSGEVTGLQAGTEYTYCLVATNTSGETFGQPVTFTTEAQRPVILSESASGITQASASLEAQIDPDNQEASYFFQYGIGESLSSATIIPGGNLVAGIGAQPVSVLIGGGLAPSTTYYYRVVATNSTGISDGPIQSFVTPAVVYQAPASSPSPGELTNGATTVLTTPATVMPPVKTTKPLTRAQRLAKALKLCKKKPRRQRAHCTRLALKRYGATATKARGR